MLRHALGDAHDQVHLGLHSFEDSGGCAKSRAVVLKCMRKTINAGSLAETNCYKRRPASTLASLARR
eukprot:1195427-Prorocentrum_minimum.AAC.4